MPDNFLIRALVAIAAICAVAVSPAAAAPGKAGLAALGDALAVRRATYPAGRIMHLVPATALAMVQEDEVDAANGVAPAGGADLAASRGPPAHGAGCGDYVLLDRVPHEAYGRIRLDRAMLTDHFIPAYLGALDAAVCRLAGAVEVRRRRVAAAAA